MSKINLNIKLKDSKGNIMGEKEKFVMAKIKDDGSLKIIKNDDGEMIFMIRNHESLELELREAIREAICVPKEKDDDAGAKFKMYIRIMKAKQHVELTPDEIVKIIKWCNDYHDDPILKGQIDYILNGKQKELV